MIKTLQELKSILPAAEIENLDDSPYRVAIFDSKTPFAEIAATLTQERIHSNILRRRMTTTDGRIIYLYPETGGKL